MAANFLPIVQQVLSAATGPATAAGVECGVNATTTATAAATSAVADISTISSFIAALFSFTALRDWIKLLVIGGFFETCRRWASYLYYKIVDSFYITAHFDQDDYSYEWLLVWLSKQPSWAKIRDVQIKSNGEGYGSLNNANIVLGGEDEILGSSAFKTARRLSYLPSLSTTYTLWYKWHLVTVTRIQEDANDYWSQKQSKLHISILAWNHSVLANILQEARDMFLKAQEHTMCVYVSDINNNWKHVACRAKRSMRSIVLDPGIKELLLDDALDFLKSKEWYSERGIPFRRGYLLYGEPGSGKTSIIHSIAGELGLDIYIITLSRSGLDDSGLSELVNMLPDRCVALMEDIDAAFTHGLNRDSDDDDKAGKPKAGSGAPPGAPAPTTTSRLSLSGLLNALDGIGAQEGRILFATTNKYTALDPALCRPGRMDLHIEFKLASRYQAKELFKRFYLPNETIKSEVADSEAVKEGAVSEKEGTATIDEKESAVKIDEKDALKKSDDSASVDSGYASSNGDSKPTTTPTTDSTITATSDSASSNKNSGTSEFFHGVSHTLRVEISPERVHQLSSEFASIIPDRECSMASLQGYLMAYKIRPEQAVKDAPEWLVKERKAKKERKEKEAEKEKREKEKREKEEKEEKEKKEKEEKEEKEKEKEEKEKKEKEDKDKAASTSTPAPKATTAIAIQTEAVSATSS